MTATTRYNIRLYMLVHTGSYSSKTGKGTGWDAEAKKPLRHGCHPGLARPCLHYAVLPYLEELLVQRVNNVTAVEDKFNAIYGLHPTIQDMQAELSK